MEGILFFFGENHEKKSKSKFGPPFPGLQARAAEEYLYPGKDSERAMVVENSDWLASCAARHEKSTEKRNDNATSAALSEDCDWLKPLNVRLSVMTRPD